MKGKRYTTEGKIRILQETDKGQAITGAQRVEGDGPPMEAAVYRRIEGRVGPDSPPIRDFKSCLTAEVNTNRVLTKSPRRRRQL